MKFKKVVARFDGPDISIAEELICDIFFSFNLKGVVCDIPLDEPDEGFGTQTLPLPEFNSITGFLPVTDNTEIQVENIGLKTANLSDLGIRVELLTEIVDEKDWADAWKDYFEVTPVTDRITIKPDWKAHTARKGEIVIRLDPGMAFGTGTHTTTSMCIKLIDAYFKPGTSFLDIGTGSGILMITACKLGAGRLVGIDIDPVAVSVARKNLEKNAVPPAIYHLACAGLHTLPEDPVDFIAANIIAQVIVDILPEIEKRMAHHTVTILSGIIKDRLKDVTAGLETCQLEVIEKIVDHEWVALAVKKR